MVMSERLYTVEEMGVLGREIVYWKFCQLPVCGFGSSCFLLYRVPIHLLGEIDMKKVGCNG